MGKTLHLVATISAGHSTKEEAGMQGDGIQRRLTGREPFTPIKGVLVVSLALAMSLATSTGTLAAVTRYAPDPAPNVLTKAERGQQNQVDREVAHWLAGDGAPEAAHIAPQVVDARPAVGPLASLGTSKDAVLPTVVIAPGTTDLADAVRLARGAAQIIYAVDVDLADLLAAVPGATVQVDRIDRSDTPGRMISWVLLDRTGPTLAGGYVSKGSRGSLAEDLDLLTPVVARAVERWQKALPPVSPSVSAQGNVALAYPTGVTGTRYSRGGAVGYTYVDPTHGMVTITVEAWNLRGDNQTDADYWVAVASQESNPGIQVFNNNWKTQEIRTKYLKTGNAYQIYRCRPNSSPDAVNFTFGWPPSFSLGYSVNGVTVTNESVPPSGYAKWAHAYAIWSGSASSYHLTEPAFEEIVPQDERFTAMFYGTFSWQETLLTGRFTWNVPPFAININKPAY